VDVKMIRTKYMPETDELVITFEDAEGKGFDETVDFKEFMDEIPTERARIEFLLSKIKDIKEKRLTNIDEFMKTIQDIVIKQSQIRDRMEEAVEVDDRKLILNLKVVHKALLDEKNTLREIRYAIKLLENDEGRLLAALLELTA